MKGIIVSSALILMGLGFGTPVLAQSDEAPPETDMEMEMVDTMIEGIEEGEVRRISETSVFPDYNLIIVSGPDDRYYTFYTQDTEDLEIGDTVYLSGDQLYLDDDAETVVAMNYDMASEEYFARAEMMPTSETVVEEREVETRDTVVIERPPVEVERTVVEPQPAAPVRALW